MTHEAYQSMSIPYVPSTVIYCTAAQNRPRQQETEVELTAPRLTHANSLARLLFSRANTILMFHHRIHRKAFLLITRISWISRARTPRKSRFTKRVSEFETGPSIMLGRDGTFLSLSIELTGWTEIIRLINHWEQMYSYCV